MPTQLTAAEALSQLSQYNTLDGLKQLASQVSGQVMGAAPDAEHFLFSYNLHADGSGKEAKGIVQGAVNGTSRVWIEQSEVGKFLKDPAFINKVSTLTGHPIDSPQLNDVLFGISDNTHGTRVNGFWDIGSESYVINGVRHDFRYCNPISCHAVGNGTH